MLTFCGILPKLNKFFIPEELQGLDTEARDFLWKLKLSNPDSIFILSNSFKERESEDHIFRFYVGKNLQYIQNKESWVDALDEMRRYEVEFVHCEFVQEDIQINSNELFLQELLNIIDNKNVIFVECPKDLKENDSLMELGQLFSKASNVTNIALISYGHLSATLDENKIFYNSQAKEVDHIFRNYLQTDLMALTNMKLYANIWDEESKEEKGILNTRQCVFDGTLVLLFSLYEFILNKKLKNFEIGTLYKLDGTHYLTCVLHRDSLVNIDYNKTYELED